MEYQTGKVGSDTKAQWRRGSRGAWNGQQETGVSDERSSGL